MAARIVDTVCATLVMLAVALVSPLIIAAYTEAKKAEPWLDKNIDKQQ